ncbi:MAG: polyphenol oxidase family protein [Holophagaceae bacterium]
MLVPQVAPPFPLRWGFTTKGDDPASLPPVRLSQVHGCGVVEASGGAVEADGIWTREPGVRIGVRVADCVPILLAGFLPDGPWVAALHAGWRGATGLGPAGVGPGILRRGVARFADLGGDPADLVWALGPAIQRCHFEVGPEVVAAAGEDPAWRAGLAAEGPRGRPHLDLHGFLRAQALDLGLDPARDGSLPLCTVCQPDLLWSWRRGDRSERQWGWIEIA